MTRTERSRAVILRAAYDLIVESPYAEVTIEKIAARAGVGKPTIYRRWPSKGPLLLDAVVEYAMLPEVAGVGDLTRDIRTWLHSLIDYLADPVTGRFMAEIVGAIQIDPDLARAWHERMFAPIRERNIALIRAAQQSGELRAGSPDLLMDLIVGQVWFRLLVTKRPISHDEVDEMLELALAGVSGDRNR
jgi:AcrR family transcriptional regulator